MCFIPSECFKATTSGLSHQQLVSEPRSSENRSVFGRYPNFQSCHKQVLIIPPCRAHPYEITAAKIISIGHRGELHAPPEYPVIVAQSQPTRPEVEDECRPRAPYIKPFKSRRAEPHAKPPAAPKNIPKNIPFASRAALSRSRADRIFRRIFLVQPQRTARRPELVF